MKLANEIRVSRSRGGGWLNLFEERELFLRTGGRMRYVTLSRRLQLGLLAAAVLFVGWVGFTTVSLVFQEQSIQAKDDEVKKAKLAYLDLLGEVTEYQSQFAALTDDLESNQSALESIVREDESLGQRWDQIQGQLKDSESQKARVAESSSALQQKLSAFQQEIGDLDDRTGTLQGTITALQDRLEDAKGERTQLGDAQVQLGEQLRTAETALADSNVEVAVLESEIAELRAALNESEVERERLAGRTLSADGQLAQTSTNLAESEDKLANLAGSVSDLEGRLRVAERDRNKAVRDQAALKGSVASLQRELLDASHREENLTSQLGELAKAMQSAVAQRDDLTKERNHLSERVRNLQVQLVGLQETQDAVLRRLSEQTRLTIDRAESLVALTGLDADEMVARIRAATRGQGGPFVPTGALDIDSMLELPSTASLLELQLDRWELLQKVMASLPVMPPLDQFTITSSFGVRKDPINGTKAKHAGLDLAAWYNTPVYAPAPGKIVFAGWRGRYGRLVEIDHGMGIRTRYGHLKKILVEPGDVVDHRHKIGNVGSSGRSTGPHVHWEVHIDGEPVDPMNFLLAGKNVFQG